MLHYQLDGRQTGPVLVFSNSLGANLSMWDWVLPRLRPHFRILRYDTRGHGQSEVTPGPYTLDQLGGDVIALLDALAIDKVFFCGLSLGGLTGQWLGVHHTDRLHKLVLCNTAARIGTIEGWHERIQAVQENGVKALAPSILARWLTEAYRTANPALAAQLLTMIGQTATDGYTACCAALRDADLRDAISRINVPTLVIAGQQDPVTTVADGQFIAEQIPDALLRTLQTAHLSAIEAADAFADALLSFLSPTSAGLYDVGMTTRRAVLGDAHVDRATANTTPFTADFQDFITRYAWGDIWTRPGLPRHSRSLITLAMLIALNREAEFRMHVRAAFNNGVTVEEIKEIIMHSALYCGLPAANAAFQAAMEVIDH
ncbi:3-oxoadipate enol-lactonase [Fibrella sp. HMF5335]|uniref:3-oxoadipate enol-lactonase n=1 Tax=Fibrella rubiginis TaxID=2817060 RepID=A0A939GIV8_9BACT|nr:3-oxoadipate enol-lactonase [Fibrella rubiginis]MBO0938270.1 3-oxoadipate enol-lactonase [Fibrella rubiginis]